MKISFWKMSGAGNDFILLPRLPKNWSGPALARRLCDRHDGVGADGLLLVDPKGRDARVDHWNSDGSAAFCGNGSRCAAAWLLARSQKNHIDLLTRAGRLSAEKIGGGRLRVSMPEPSDFKLGLKLGVLGKTYSVDAVRVGVPHAVVFVPSLTTTNVRELGRALRRHRAFGKDGANVNFVRKTGAGIEMRTYERGVEDETLACGSGIVAAAAVYRRKNPRSAAVVAVRARSGALLSVRENPSSLEGPAVVVFTGEVDL